MFLAVFLCTLLRNLDLLINYRPDGDDFAVVQASRSWQPTSWFLEGFSKYFLVFPSSTPPYTNFLRPGVNLWVYFAGTVFGDALGAYFLLAIIALSISAGGTIAETV